MNPFVAQSLRLDVQDPVDGLVNLNPNPDGARGGWGYYISSGYVAGVPYPSELSGTALAFDDITGTAPITTATFPSVPQTAGNVFGFIYFVLTLPTGVRVGQSLEQYDVDDNLVRSFPASFIDFATARRSQRYSANPSNVVRAVMKIHIQWNGVAAADRRVVIGNWRATEAPTLSSGELVDWAAHPTTYTSIIDDCHSLTVKREELNVGTLEAEIRSTALDPSTSDALRGDQPIRLEAPLAGVWEPIYTGRVDAAPVAYTFAADPAQRARIALAAVDETARLARAAARGAVARIDHLAAVIANAQCGPWRVNGSVAGIVDPGRIYGDPAATAVDQVAITRDSTLGYAWVDRYGFVCAYDADQIPAAAVGTLTEADYGEDIDIGFDVATVINDVTITVRRINAATGEVVDVPHGPYRDLASVRRWGVRSATFTVHSIAETDAALRAYAARIFAANAQPATRVNSLTIAVETPADLARHKSHIDLYDAVRVINTDQGIDQTLRVATIEHTITPETWLVTLGFVRAGVVATPQQLNTPGTTATGGGGGSAEAVYDFIPDAGFEQSTIQFTVVDGICFVSGSLVRSGWSSINYVQVGTIPLGARPKAPIVSMLCASIFNTAVTYQLNYRDTGEVFARRSSATGGAMAADGSWPVSNPPD